ncbi:PP2C family protein-serine/threonine phosphatase [Thiohalomonas denitrificans]|uniref:Serine/threonine protein phosphatase PrpC n=1 Tax=Thiohalomonas denitrificans TaxID=415747 RepID=A0A1G5QST6_9GAMM|nr:protein phosphatase 2C domain-containing protein [Thiohalomonas denitrificans]SCZ64923.1 Serine/threonine protein phosphatase PrpC [Thiohalomonas denitrificans]
MQYETGCANRLGNRTSNQDRLTAIETDEGILLVLADGMGGLEQGEIAAQAVVDAARELYLNSPRPVSDTGGLLRDIIHRSHDRLVEDLSPDQEHSSSGTTAVLCLVQNGEAHWAHVGDSRLYFFRGGRSIYRTRDHSYVESLYRQGLIDDEERSRHPRRNQITQCIGCTRYRPDVALAPPVALQEKDVLMLCSDGLWDSVKESELADLLGCASTLEESMELMADRAENSAYPNADNISVVALRFLKRLGRRRPVQLVRERPAPEKLESAIDQIQQIIHEYEKEMDR